jgi:DNA-binding transcriptional regulator YiaG
MHRLSQNCEPPSPIFHTRFRKTANAAIDNAPMPAEQPSINQTVGELVRQSFEAIKAHQRESMQRVRMRYVQQLGVTESTVRAWQQGSSRPKLDHIEVIAADAIKLGRMDERWLKTFLHAYGLDRTANSLSERLFDVLEQQTVVQKNASPGPHPFWVRFGSGEQGRSVPALFTSAKEEIEAALTALNLQTHRPVLVLIGGADGLSDERRGRIRCLFNQVLVPLCQQSQITVVDGATDSGVIQLMGEARTKHKATFPLVGVAAKGTIQWEGDELQLSSKAKLEPNHTHFILVPGTEWSDECKWISAAASAISERQPSLTLVANGGATTWQDIVFSFTAGRPVIALEGTGRAADGLASALQNGGMNALAQAFGKLGFAHATHISQPNHLAELLTTLLHTND